MEVLEEDDDMKNVFTYEGVVPEEEFSQAMEGESQLFKI